MPVRLSLLTVLLLLAALLLAAGAHGEPAVPTPLKVLSFEEPLEVEVEEEGESEAVETACDTAYEEADEGELGYDEAEEICAEEEDEARPAAKPRGGKAQAQAGKSRHRPHRRGKACRRNRATGGKRHCPRHRSQRQKQKQRS